MTTSTTGSETQTEPETTGPSTLPTSPKSVPTAKRRTKESTPEKAIRYLTEARLTVKQVEGDLVKAECRGDSGKVYRLSHENGLWLCSCPARTSCSHMMALWLVTVAG